MEQESTREPSAEDSRYFRASMATGETSVLVVEDEKLVNWSLVKSLTKWGFKVNPVFTGRDALKELQISGFDIVLLDYRLPDLDGLEVARQIRHLHPDAVILMVTSFQLSELPPDRELVNYHFNKPLNLEQLRGVLTRISKTRELET